MTRTLLALLLVASLPAAVEDFTLADGRRFVGEYDDETGHLHTMVGKSMIALAVPRDQIVERKRHRPAKPGDDAATTPDAGGLRAMTPEQKESAHREFLYAQKVRLAQSLDAEAAKASRNAARAREDAEKKRADAKRHGKKFSERSVAEGEGGHNWESATSKLYHGLIVLKRTAGNNRTAFEAWQSGAQMDRKASDLDALAGRKTAEATATRAEAGRMPRAPLDQQAADAPEPEAVEEDAD
ncbi:MAG: hypothetical protein H0W48_00560 [Methylibium sp.]|nr:hypothetical protein [Methylibium sp.]